VTTKAVVRPGHPFTPLDIIRRITFAAAASLGAGGAVVRKTEKEVDTEDGETILTMPSLECLGVVRQTGRVGVVKTASVELSTARVHGLARADALEIPLALRAQTDRPIVLAFK